MAAPGGAAAPCACTNISIMQLFHELKQQFPAVPDHVVSSTIESHCHDRSACRSKLECEAKSLASQPYPSASLQGRRPKRDGADADADADVELPRSCLNAPKDKDCNQNAVARPQPESDCAACRADADRKPPAPAAKVERPASLPLRRPSVYDEDYPLNVSFNLNCQMNMSRQIFKPHPDLPQRSPFASVNLTVCTPTDPRRSTSTEDAFEGNVHITVNSAPCGSDRNARRNDSPVDAFSSPIELIIRKQKTQLERLEVALKADRARLISMRREVRTLRAPPPSFPTIVHLRCTVQQLHASCQRLTEQLDDVTARSSGERSDNANRLSANEPSSAEEGGPPWQCHVCTFDNQPLLNKCEMCEMPRIILVHGNDEITVQLHPVYNKIAKSWI